MICEEASIQSCVLRTIDAYTTGQVYPVFILRVMRKHCFLCCDYQTTTAGAKVLGVTCACSKGPKDNCVQISPTKTVEKGMTKASSINMQLCGT